VSFALTESEKISISFKTKMFSSANSVSGNSHFQQTRVNCSKNNKLQLRKTYLLVNNILQPEGSTLVHVIAQRKTVKNCYAGFLYRST